MDRGMEKGPRTRLGAAGLERSRSLREPEHDLCRDRREQGRERARERLDAAVRMLEKETGRILDSDTFRDYLRSVGRFHTYSASNISLIRAQRPDATRVAGYRTWQDLGRQVRRGEKGMTIIVPLKRTAKLDDPDTGEEVEFTSVRGFGTGNVFDISQTDGKSLPEPPACELIRESTQPGRELYARLESWLSRQGVEVSEREVPGAWGSYSPLRREITVHPEIARTDQGAKTLAHEAAHFAAGHVVGMDEREIEPVAEGAAYAVLSRYGLDSGSYSFSYIARWAEDRERLGRNLEAIRKVAHNIIEGLEGGEDG